MLLKSARTPIFTAIPTKTKRARSFSLLTTICNSTTQNCPQPVRQNATVNTTPSLLLLHKLPPTAAYIHLPFCRKRCHYCDFPIIALGSSSSSSAYPKKNNDGDNDDPRVSNYVDTLCREIRATNCSPISENNNNPPLKTVFFGGGTPSLVPPHLISSVLDTLSSKFGLCGDAEISIEMDPGTFDEVAMKTLMSLGVNRVSLGVQAFQDDLLKACGRAHGVAEVYEAVEIVRSCGVGNWSLDLISSLPRQTPSMWEESLRLAIRAQPTHVSVYDLQVEQGTKFGVLYSPGEYPLPSENQSAEFYRTASKFLHDACYDHYEISSYSKSGYRCKHNTTYWENKPFYAFGLGSASYVGGLRFSRPRRLKEYVDYVRKLERGAANFTTGGAIDAKELAKDVVMLSLRTSDGLDLKCFREAFGDSLTLSICEVFKPHVESGHVMCLDEEGRNVAYDEFINVKSGFVRLSDPDGFLLSNELLSLAFGVIDP